MISFIIIVFIILCLLPPEKKKERVIEPAISPEVFAKNTLAYLEKHAKDAMVICDLYEDNMYLTFYPTHMSVCWTTRSLSDWNYADFVEDERWFNPPDYTDQPQEYIDQVWYAILNMHSDYFEIMPDGRIIFTRTGTSRP